MNSLVFDNKHLQLNFIFVKELFDRNIIRNCNEAKNIYIHILQFACHK